MTRRHPRRAGATGSPGPARRRPTSSSPTRRTGGSTRRRSRTRSPARSTRSAGSSRSSSTGAPGFVVDGHARVALALSRGEPTVPVLYVDLEPEEEALVLATLDPIGAMAGRDDEKLRALLADVTVDDAGLLALLGDLARQRAEGRADRPRRGARAARGAVRQAGRALAPRRPPAPVRRRDERRRRRAAARRGGADAARDRPALRRPARPDLARRRLQRPAQAGQGLGRRGRRREAVHDARGPRRPSEAHAGQARAPHRGPPQHLDQHGHPGRLVRGVRPRAVAPGRLRLVREHPHPRGRCRACSASASSSPARSSGTRASSRSGAPGTTGPTSPASSSAGRACRTCSSASATRRRSGGPPARSGSAAAPRRRRRTTRPRSRCSSPRSRSATTSGRARRCTSRSAGSGTTLMAAETLGRRCYAMEIDPKYVQVAIERWQRFTGRTAERRRWVGAGPAPTPTKVKRLRGETRPSRLNLREPLPSAGRPEDAAPTWTPTPRSSGGGSCATCATRASSGPPTPTSCAATARRSAGYAQAARAVRAVGPARPRPRRASSSRTRSTRSSATTPTRSACSPASSASRRRPGSGLRIERERALRLAHRRHRPPAAASGGRRCGLSRGPRCPHRRPPLRRLLRALHPPHQGPLGRPAPRLRGLAARVLVGGPRVRPRHRPPHLQRGRPRHPAQEHASPRWPAPPASTCSTPTASPSPRSTSPRPPATRPASCSARPGAWSSAARSCSTGSSPTATSSSAPATAGSCARLSSDAALQHGLNPSANIIDELHAHKTAELYTALTTGTGAREQPFTLWITHRRRRRRGHPRRAVRVDVRRIRRARGPRLAPHLPRPRQRHPHLLVRRPARRRHRGPRGLVRREPRLLAPRRQVPGRPVRAPRARGALLEWRRYHLNQFVGFEDAWLRDGAWRATRPATCRSTPPSRSASASTRARTASSARSRSRSARGTGSW